MPINGFLYPGASGPPTPYDVANSCRFDDGSSAYMNRSNGTPSSRRQLTVSTWLKRAGGFGNYQYYMGIQDTGDGDPRINFGFDDSDRLYISETNNAGQQVWAFNTTRVFRDPAAWMNIVCSIDTTQSTEANRLKIYVNGTQETAFATSSYPSENLDLANTGNEINIGCIDNNSPSGFFDGYLTEVVYCDGQALDQTSFGEFDSDSPNIWKPINVSGLTFGNNGFYLDFEDSSNLGNDANGGTDFTENNLTSIDQTTDTCTNNFATINPLSIHPSSTFTISKGNLQFATSSSTRGYWISTFGVSSGKWYWEYKVTNNQARTDVGIAGAAAKGNNDPESGVHDDVTVYLTINGQVNINSNSSTDNFYNQATSSNNIIIGTALDLDSSPNTIAFSIDGEWVTGSGTKSTTFSSATKINSFTNVASTVNGVYHFIAGDDGGEQDIGGQANFGNPPFSISSGNSDANSYGNFEYAVPSGYYSLNTKNLAEFG